MPQKAILVFLISSVLGSTSAVASTASLSFDERVRAQGAVERVYHAHREKETRPFELAVPRAALERKVREHLELSAKVEKTHGVSIDRAALQAELARIESKTSYPDRLEELFAALGHDPVLVEETLARARLVRRLASGGPEAGPPAVSTALGTVCSDVWSNGVLDDGVAGGSPTARTDHSAVWTGSEMIVWGGFGGGVLDTGGRYDPVLDSWTPTSTTGAPSPRADHAAIWTGSEMIVWGGTLAANGGRYDPVTDTWSGISSSGAPAIDEALAVWTGVEMIVWGRTGGSPATNLTVGGGRYYPSSDSWLPMSTTDEPAPRIDATAVWTGSEMIVWGGVGSGSVHFRDGAHYDPVTDLWTPMPILATLFHRRNHSAVWTGTEMIVFGGEHVGIVYNAGGAYDPATGTWRSVDAPDSTEASRHEHSAVWTGTEMIVWSGRGFAGNPVRESGFRFDPTTDSWQTLSTLNAPGGSFDHTAIWTGDIMIVWGGGVVNPSGTLDTGGIYGNDLLVSCCPGHPLQDPDFDELCFGDDNCPSVQNADQSDLDGDGEGDACDDCTDTDDDGFGDPGFPATVCVLDNCPDQPNSGQENEDGDALGDLCDPCLGDPINDPDGDEICASGDNCPFVFNTALGDFDADGVGDLCDPCTDSDGDGFGNPGFVAGSCPVDNCGLVANPSQVDSDGDGFGDACDSCSTIGNAEQDEIDSLINVTSPEALDQAFSFILYSPVADRFVYPSRDSTDFMLFSVPPTGGLPTRLTPPGTNLPTDDAMISPDGNRVLYRDSCCLQELSSTSMFATDAKRLGVSVEEFDVSADSSSVVYRSFQSTGVDGQFELFRSPIDSVPPVKLSGTMVSGGSVEGFEISPDSGHVVYLADQNTDDQFELFSVPTVGGAIVALTSALPATADVSDFAISPDSQTVFYLANADDPTRVELYRVPVLGGPSIKLHPSLPGNDDILDFVIAPNGQSVAYRYSPIQSVEELFIVPASGGTPLRIAPQLDSISSVYLFTSDSQHLVFHDFLVSAHHLSSDRTWSVTQPGAYFDFKLSPDGQSVAHRVFDDGLIELEVTSLFGGPSVRVSNDSEMNDHIRDFRFGPDGTRVVYVRGTDGTPGDYFSSRVDGSAAIRLTPVSETYHGVEVSSDGEHIAWVGPNGPLTIAQLVPDSDGDHALDTCDCAAADGNLFASPPEIAFVSFDDRTSLRWASADPDAGQGVIYDLLRGSTSVLPVGTGESCLQASLALPEWDETDTPALDSCFFYIVRGTNPCGVGTYGSDSDSVERVSTACP